MTALTSLWLPIFVSAIVVFIASSVIHMAPLWHKHDYPMLPNQDAALDALRPLAIPPGDYMLPRAKNMQDMKTPEYAEKVKRGPVVIMTVVKPGPIAMGPTFVQWFIFVAIVSYFAAYLAGRALPPGADYLEVFRFAGTTAFIGYSLALWPHSIWYHRAWSSAIKETFDGLIYGLLTAGVFGWLWPR